MQDIESILREAGRSRRRVLIRVVSSTGDEYQREMEPYAITDGELYAFSCFRHEYRTLPLREIVEVEITPRTFEPRRPVDL